MLSQVIIDGRVCKYFCMFVHKLEVYGTDAQTGSLCYSQKAQTGSLCYKEKAQTGRLWYERHNLTGYATRNGTNWKFMGQGKGTNFCEKLDTLLMVLKGSGIGVPSDHKQLIGRSDLRIATDNNMLTNH